MLLRFGDFVLDEAARRLRRGGADVHLSARAFDLLVVLIRARPRVLSKEDLHARLWPATYVSDTSLAMLVAEVRAALGDTPRDSAYVRTVHRRGYAFEAQAHALDATGAQQAPASTANCWAILPGSRVPLPPGTYLVGRDPAAHLWLDAAGVSRHHACITVAPDCAVIEDLGSKNGTRVRGSRLSGPAVLADGDEVRVGPARFTVRFMDVPSTKTDDAA